VNWRRKHDHARDSGSLVRVRCSVQPLSDQNSAHRVLPTSERGQQEQPHTVMQSESEGGHRFKSQQQWQVQPSGPKVPVETYRHKLNAAAGFLAEGHDLRREKVANKHVGREASRRVAENARVESVLAQPRRKPRHRASLPREPVHQDDHIVGAAAAAAAVHARARDCERCRGPGCSCRISCERTSLSDEDGQGDTSTRFCWGRLPSRNEAYTRREHAAQRRERKMRLIRQQLTTHDVGRCPGQTATRSSGALNIRSPQRAPRA
jgi:hypothetical protein